jgi:hypothetical protein
MATIIAGRFAQQDVLEQAAERLQQAGFADERISSFFVTPPGQHDKYPIGGDHDVSTGAEHSTQGTVLGAATGGTVGAVAGIAATPLLGPVGLVAGALVGAHVGSLVGSMSKMDEFDEEPERVRHAGLMLAVSTQDADEEARVAELLCSSGALDVERNEGSIVDGDWIDFDPLIAPTLVCQPEAQQPPPAAPDASGRQSV